MRLEEQPDEEKECKRMGKKEENEEDSDEECKRRQERQNEMKRRQLQGKVGGVVTKDEEVLVKIYKRKRKDKREIKNTIDDSRSRYSRRNQRY